MAVMEELAGGEVPQPFGQIQAELVGLLQGPVLHRLPPLLTGRGERKPDGCACGARCPHDHTDNDQPLSCAHGADDGQCSRAPSPSQVLELATALAHHLCPSPQCTVETPPRPLALPLAAASSRRPCWLHLEASIVST
eukprot:CAMPEP_0118962634 /NCGR_PEP_ID=MMETSP1173-20130426/899_1 /TAXON_ID=1034831 /ORGANISM="Rhizochromulina marina cf, Strain CCMP1243" /LENGTH=137 /DNA_ID=CAMNT_0006910919 /DNA_START=114 /DNA_END=524 /DNA_ORIENTATION=-